jgi:DNA-binding transcriptional LysR family regulator
MRTQTKYIDTFVAAMEAGSFVRAAELLHVTPSTVSYQIKQLELWLGAPLFERSGRKVLPTALAERLFSICGRFIDELSTLRVAARGHDGPARQALRIATGSSFGRYVLTPILSQASFAETIINLRFGMDDDVCAAVAAGRADLGFSYTVIASNTLHFTLAYRYPLVLIAPYSVAPSGSLERWITDTGFITYDDCEPTFARWFDAELGGMPTQLRTMGRCTELEETIAMVAAGRGLSIVPGYMVASALRGKKIRAISPGQFSSETASQPHTKGKAGPSAAATTDTVYCVSRKGTALDGVAADLLATVRHGQKRVMR